jgi:hypothetical protein
VRRDRGLGARRPPSSAVRGSPGPEPGVERVVAARLARRRAPGVGDIPVRRVARGVPGARAGREPRPGDLHQRPGVGCGPAAAAPSTVGKLARPRIAEVHEPDLVLDRRPRGGQGGNPRERREEHSRERAGRPRRPTLGAHRPMTDPGRGRRLVRRSPTALRPSPDTPSG